MDRSSNSSVLGNRSPFSPRSRPNATGKRNIAPPAFRKSSRFSLSGRSTQSVQVVLKSQSNCVERFGQPLPVLITEALTFADRNTVVSARISSECGYAWLVCGRRLLVWQYRQSPVLQQNTPQRRGAISNQCYELQLPQSDLAHRAELVSVFISLGTNVPSCIAVSPEGVVRYWPGIAHEGISVEQCIDLQGQECDSLTGVEGLGCILATTTCTVVLVQPNLVAGRHSLNCRTMKTASGWLGGISKRMSSLIFGPISSEQSAETRLVRVLSIPTSENTWTAFVLAGHSLQKWHLSSNEPDALIYMSDLTRLVRDGFYGTVWENVGGDHSDTDTWLLDIQSDNENIVLLAAAVNMHLSPQIHYCMICVDTSSNQAPIQFSNFLVLKMTGLYREENPSDSLGYRFLLSGSIAYIYNHRSITVIKPQEEPDCLEFKSPPDFLLGGSICVNTPVFFFRNHGLVAISSTDFSADLSMSVASPGTPVDNSFSDMAMENLTLYNFNPDEMYTAYKDTVGQMKAAFIFHVQNQQTACNDILQELFLSEGAPLPGIDAIQDKVIVLISTDLLDDIPGNDPRWLGENQVGIGSSYAMQVLKQLEDKRKALSLLIKFLKDTDLWNKLCAVTTRDSPLATTVVLAEHAEKIVAAIALKTLPYNEIMQKAVQKSIEDINMNSDNGLTNQDIFYRKVIKVYVVLQELVNICEDAAHSDMNPVEIAQLLNGTNQILLNVLKEVIQYRNNYNDQYKPNATAVSLAPDYLPWTSAAGSEGVMDYLMKQQYLTYNYGAKLTSDYTLRNSLYEQLVSLIDFILDGRKCHLESIVGSEREEILLKQYETDRHKLILPLIKDKQWEGAAVLAEKYLDFESLVLICEKTDNQTRLDEYMDRFSKDGFAQFVYTWYLQENKQGKLIDRCRRVGDNKNTQELRNFLSEHPSLSWIQNGFDKKFDDAAETLKKFANEETESVTRQKTMLSMAKLAKLAAGDSHESDFINNVNANLDLIAYQEEIPDYLIQQFGFDTIKPRVLPAKDLIHLYICDEYKDATEIEFKKALDLLPFVLDEELRTDLTLQIWKNAVLRDKWDDKNLDCPLEILQNKLFFKIVDLALVLGADPNYLLPPLDILNEDPDMSHLLDNKNFQFLIKTGYEHVAKIMQM